MEDEIATGSLQDFGSIILYISLPGVCTVPLPAMIIPLEPQHISAQ
jgi:hypothetical protein